MITLTPEQQKERIASLFDGDTSVSMSEGDRIRTWLEQIAERIEVVLGVLEDLADAERTFEVLCVADLLAAPGLDGTYTAKARDWVRRARAILRRSEFGPNSQMIDDRLTEVLGREASDRMSESSH